jgi:hypothetical protein
MMFKIRCNKYKIVSNHTKTDIDNISIYIKNMFPNELSGQKYVDNEEFKVLKKGTCIYFTDLYMNKLHYGKITNNINNTIIVRNTETKTLWTIKKTNYHIFISDTKKNSNNLRNILEEYLEKTKNI